MIPIELIQKVVISLVAKIWKIVVKWLITTVKVALAKAAIEGVKYFIKETKKACLQIAKMYEKQGRQWFVNEVTKVLSFNEVPSDLKGRTILDEEVDFSDDLQDQLELTL